MGRKGWWTKEQKSERWEMEVNRTPGEGSVKRERESERRQGELFPKNPRGAREAGV